ncbi:MAG TPA: response regulator transcription factor [Candidatus Binatia bacterium]|nr:response regulator transcription factor [Candidatus Binatia bacterium]
MSPPASLRVVIADDHTIFREGLRSILTLHPEMQVVGEVANVEDLPRLLADTPCDLLLLDLQMERRTMTDIEQLARRVAVVVLTASELAADAIGAIHAGARAVVFKRFAVETLVDVIHAVARGEVWIPPALRASFDAAPQPSPADRLTAREREIVRHVAVGLRNAEVAERLGISEVTVKAHLNSAFHKIGVRDRVELAVYAIRTGIVALDQSPSPPRRTD